MIRVANAPCSWGALEFDLEGEAPGYVQVLDEVPIPLNQVASFSSEKHEDVG